MNATFSNALRELAEPRPIGDLVKAAIGRASRLTGLSYTRTFDVWYGKARRIDAHEAEQIAAALERKRENEARNEIADLRARLLKMESRIAAEAAHHHRDRIEGDGLRLRGLSGEGRALARAGRKGR